MSGTLNRRVAIVLSALLASVLAGPRAARANGTHRDFTVVNHTGTTLVSLTVSEDEQNRFGGNLLPGRLPNGGRALIHFASYASGGCLFDLEIADTDGNGWKLEDADLCRTSEITFQRQGSRVVYTAR